MTVVRFMLIGLALAVANTCAAADRARAQAGAIAQLSDCFHVEQRALNHLEYVLIFQPIDAEVNHVQAIKSATVEALESRTLMTAAPAHFAALGASTTKIALNWIDATNDEMHFILDRSTDGMNYYRLTSLAANTTHFTDNDLKPGTKYFYRMKAIAPDENSGWALASGKTLLAIAMPAAPSNLVANATSSSQIKLSWKDNSTDEMYFILERSVDGKNYSRIFSPAAGATAYTDIGLTPNATYYYRIKALGAAGSSQWTGAIGKTQATASTVALGSLSQSAVNAAIAAPMIRYNRDIVGGAFTNGAWFGGASIALALASYTGNTTADARLLQQMRYTLVGGNEIVADGGYAAQHEMQVTGMYALAKLTPRIWNQLTAREHQKIDLVMEAALVASAFTTSDNSPFIKSGQPQRTLDGDDVNRDWNPNYREGMIGAMLVGAAYFGPTNAEKILDNYDHQAFVDQLAAAKLTNLYQTFTWKSVHPESTAPDAATIQQGVKNYSYYGSPLTDLMGIDEKLLVDTYGGKVNAGLNGGAGINGAGKMVAGASSLPNQGALGMLLEFDSSDASGARSAVDYAYDGFRPHQTCLLVLIASGNWDKNSAIAKETAARLKIGNADLWYKIDHGYVSYANGKQQVTLSFAADSVDWGFVYNRAMWEQVLQPYLWDDR